MWQYSTRRDTSREMQLPDLSFHEYLAVLNWLARGFDCLARAVSKWRQKSSEALENRILDYLNTKAVPSTASIVWADVFLRPIIEDVPFQVAFPPHLRGWRRFKHELRSLPFELRHRWRVLTRLVSEERVREILLKLLREQRIDYNPATELYSRRR